MVIPEDEYRRRRKAPEELYPTHPSLQVCGIPEVSRAIPFDYRGGLDHPMAGDESVGYSSRAFV